MKSTILISRRALSSCLLGVLIAPAAACKPRLECTDTNLLSAADLDLRTRTLHYRERSEDPSRACSGCQQFKPHGENVCGGCVVVRGPINPGGRCDKWAAKPV